MISKIYVVFLFCILPILATAREINVKNGGVAVLRPVLFRSEFVRGGAIRAFRQNSMKEGFDVFGFPEFNPILSYKLNVFETTLAQTRYYREMMLKKWAPDIASRPDVFDKTTIDLYKSYLRGEVQSDSLKNPVLKSGEKTCIHHGRDGYELVAEAEHGKKHHFGGAETYGYKYAKISARASAKIPNREIILTAHRWGKFVALDLAFSTIGFGISGESDWRTYAVNAGASTTAGFVAWGVESLLITSFPLLQGSTPVFIGGMAINIGGPASWIATGAFLLIKYSIMAGWERYQIQTALAVEARCRQAEKMACFNHLKKQCQRNTEELQTLLAE